jgi:NADP-dependent 3-hydroxy acid dehydrogenase YdfG
MDLGLDGKIVPVTGSTAGTGFASARRFALEGASVIINGRSAQRVDASVETIRREVAGAAVRGVVAHVSSAIGVRALTLIVYASSATVGASLRVDGGVVRAIG